MSPMKDILQEIVAHKREELARMRAQKPSLREALLQSDTGIIAEFKRRSPSKGWIKEEGRANIIPLSYQQNGAAALSILTDVHLTNNFLPLIIPAIAAPSTVFFMRQYMIPSLSLEIIESARIDGAKEFYTFNTIALPIMKPAIATQAIFIFVSKWNELFMPLVLLTKHDRYTMPIMVSLLRGDIYRTEYGSIYLGLLLTVLPLFVVYFLLSKYIIAGVALGSVKG